MPPDRITGKKQDPGSDPHQSEKVKALVSHFGGLEGSNLEKSEWYRTAIKIKMILLRELSFNNSSRKS